MTNIATNPSVKKEAKTLQQSMQLKFRQKRFAHFLSLLQSIKPADGKTIRILDIGGTETYWKMVDFENFKNMKITLLNLQAKPISNPLFESVVGDACNLSEYKDKQFDVVFSNSVIEHVGDFEMQKKMAKEFRRVGKNYYLQTPNYHFFFEPHWRFPFFQFLPVGTRIFLTDNFDLGNYTKAKNKKVAKSRVDNVKLLTVKQMKKLFPEAKFYPEKFLGMTKSIVMYSFPGVDL